jgi:hypothetical protein
MNDFTKAEIQQIRITIQSNKYGPQEFWATKGAGSYVFLETKKPVPGQICEGGGFVGAGLMFDGTEDGLARVAGRWWKQYMRLRRGSPGMR